MRGLIVICEAVILLAASSASAGSAYNGIGLGNLNGQYSVGLASNNNGQIVGMTYDAQQNPMATLFDVTGEGSIIDLGGGPGSEALAINDNGQIVGITYDSQQNSRATLFDTTGGGNNIDLGGGPGSKALSINDNGQIVMITYDSKRNPKVKLLDTTGGKDKRRFKRPNKPRTRPDATEYAYSIDNSGRSADSDINPNGYSQACLLTPVSPAILLLGLGGMMLRKKK
jgi:uncharacterized membrane protein